MEKKWIARRYSVGDEKLILEFRRVIRGETHSDAYWRHRYLNNPAGPAIIWLAIADGAVVGHSATVPTWFKVGDRIVKAGHSADAWTHPDFRRQGILTTLRSHELEDAVGQGIELTYSFPSKLSYGVSIKLGFRHLFDIPAMRRITDWTQVVQARMRLPLATVKRALFPSGKASTTAVTGEGQTTIRRLTTFDKRFDTLWQRASRHSTAMVVRDSTYLNWRYAGNPRYDYRVYAAEENGDIVGYIVVNCIRGDIDRGYLVDMLLLPDRPDVFRMLVKQSINDLRAQGTGTIHGWMLKDTPYSGILMQNQFQVRPANIERFCVLTLSETIQELVQGCEDWWLWPCDHDA